MEDQVDQLGLFEKPQAIPNVTKKHNSLESGEPLAYRSRPLNISNFLGQGHLFQRFPFLKGQTYLPGLILWGPPGCGKTTLAHILAKQFNKELYCFNAVLSGVAELRKLIERAVKMKVQYGLWPIIFIDEIHRFNKAQQDALLPHVEAGDFILFGATTENPRSALNKALISRLQIIELKKLAPQAVEDILKEVCKNEKKSINDNILKIISHHADGDARKALNILEVCFQDSSLDEIKVKKIILENVRDYDKSADRHYDVISAFIKSLRGSDPDAALLWLAVMLDGGEDPFFIVRRLVIFASEDIGNADPSALSLATSAMTAVKNIGMPEARIILAQSCTYLATTVKSNASYLGINQALEYVQSRPTIQVPDHLRNFPVKKEEYKYPHQFENHFVKQKYTEEKIPFFYRPGNQGREKIIKELHHHRWPERKND